jgi:hypothetical protein
LDNSTNLKDEGVEMREKATKIGMNVPPAEGDIQRKQAIRQELVERMTHIIREDGRIEALPGLYFSRANKLRYVHGVSTPSFCVMAQGSKEIFLGNECYHYDPAHYLLFTADFPL